ncbi:hypothetical protein CUU95_15555 [Vreelandella alkaliphila]|uniref:hypothetical protein n=1 Tax=Vreelandella alkaliphila TaxID=272774 RepID=UPI000EA3DA09|nr:hypothetical protein [Halomonas alkaliphila]AYF35148.1 hypothetical protein CUU95_15555 [Halomonas alkaliphila]
MKRLPLTAPSLRAWRKRDSITSGQAAYLLAGLEPVKSPNPSLPPNAKAVYGHLLNAIYSGDLSAHKITRRIEPDTAWVDSLSPEEYMKWGCEWGEISSTDLKQDNSKYRFSIDAQLFFTWADAGGWFKNTQPKAHKKPLNGFNVIAVRLALTSGAPATRVDFLKAMDRYGIPHIGKNILDPTLKAAKDESTNLNLNPNWSGPAPEATMRLLEFAYLFNTLKTQWTNKDLDGAKKTWREAREANRLDDLLRGILDKQQVRPKLTTKNWQALKPAIK